MERNPLRPSESFSDRYNKYGAMLYKIAVVYMGNKHDAEEAVQDVFIKLLYQAPPFQDSEHEKAWLIRVLTNGCKNKLRGFWRKRAMQLEDIESWTTDPEHLGLLESVLRLPVKYKAVIHLHYYEDYSVKQIAETLQIGESAVKMRLARGRQLLKLELEGE
ncbi:RNA polymerase sigma factor [Paenibacillus koleovorans]|uniref:RNA polymerase sigma factor n=1 Tax=Paenibacillus koleovorans TaxID=121608 RepID=UPI000FDA6D2F|nr:sigma-70 family RNA polymerase sigma factor [Paenibacillus koleovorans]